MTMSKVGDLESFFPAISWDTISQLEHLLGGLISGDTTEPIEGQPERGAPSPLAPSMSTRTISSREDVSEGPSSGGKGGAEADLEHSFAILLKAIDVLEETSSKDRKALGHLGVREQLARTEQMLYEWKLRAMKAEGRIEKIMAAISRV